uniref:HTH CENPB-type domain-containing protein n=1 Tax=Parascaris univalens TaxID=6257 RepID=A0A914ZPD8_PARUN
VGNRWIRETARNLAQQQCSQQELAGMCQFSERWLSNFKKRYHINLNRDWSSGSSSLGSGESIGSASSTTGDSGHPSPNKNDESVDGDESDAEGCASDADSATSDSLETLIDADDFNESLISIGAEKQHLSEILNKPGQLPIQAFYERFPWLCRKNNVGAEPGRRGRKVQFPDVEKVLFERLQQRQSNGD